MKKKSVKEEIVLFSLLAFNFPFNLRYVHGCFFTYIIQALLAIMNFIFHPTQLLKVTGLFINHESSRQILSCFFLHLSYYIKPLPFMILIKPCLANIKRTITTINFKKPGYMICMR